MKSIFSSVVALAVISTASSTAFADRGYDVDAVTGMPVPGTVTVSAPRRAFELSPSVGYTQGFGNVKSGQSFPTVATTGLGLGLDAGYRLSPGWSFSVAGQYQEYSAVRAIGVRGATFSLAATHHFAAFSLADPWCTLASGYRILWTDGQVTGTVDHGFQIARLTFGLDLPATDSVAIAPVGGLDLDMFAFESGDAIAGPRSSLFVFMGVQGRFIIGGERERREVRAHPASPALASD